MPLVDFAHQSCQSWWEGIISCRSDAYGRKAMVFEQIAQSGKSKNAPVNPPTVRIPATVLGAQPVPQLANLVAGMTRHGLQSQNKGHYIVPAGQIVG